MLDRTRMLHLEVETVPCIGKDQRLFPDVERLLIDSGFALLATDHPRTSMQLNALFVRADLLQRKGTDIRWHAADAQLRRRVGAALASFVLCVWVSYYHPNANFFLAPPRAWELLLGPLVALGVGRSLCVHPARDALARQLSRFSRA